MMLAFFRPPPKEEDSEFVRQAMSAAKDIQDQIANGERTIDIPAVRSCALSLTVLYCSQDKTDLPLEKSLTSCVSVILL